MTDIGHEAAIPNPALAPLSFLVGEWRTEGSHPQIQGTLHGRTTFAWSDGGAFLVMRSEIDEPGVPSGIAIFGTDDDSKECSMLYSTSAACRAATSSRCAATSGSGGVTRPASPNASLRR